MSSREELQLRILYFLGNGEVKEMTKNDLLDYKGVEELKYVAYLLRTSAAVGNDNRHCIQSLIEEISANIKLKSMMYGKNYPLSWEPKFVNKQGVESSIEKIDIKISQHSAIDPHVKIKRADGTQTFVIEADFKEKGLTLTDLRIFLPQIGSYDKFSREFKRLVHSGIVEEEKRLLEIFLKKNTEFRRIYS